MNLQCQFFVYLRLLRKKEGLGRTLVQIDFDTAPTNKVRITDLFTLTLSFINFFRVINFTSQSFVITA